MPQPYILFASNNTGHRAGRIVRGVLHEARRRGWGLLWREFEACDVSRLNPPPIGVIAWGKLAEIQTLVRRVGPRVPVVSTIGHTLDLDLPTVVPDPDDIARQVAAHLVAEDLRSFIYVGSDRNPASRLRADAFERELARLIPAPRVRRFAADFEERFWGADSERGRAFMALLEQGTRPVGVFAFNDQIAASCLECAEIAGVPVPRELSIVGVDDHPIFAHLYQPLSSVRIDYEKIGRTAVGLVAQMQTPAGRAAAALRTFVGGELVVRVSSQPRLLGDEPISRVLHHINDHLGTALTLVALARLAGMSRASFAERFHRAVGSAPIRYLIELRLSRAKLLLAESTLTVAEIAYKVGFEDQGYFTRAFKRRWRMTPTEFRRALA